MKNICLIIFIYVIFSCTQKSIIKNANSNKWHYSNIIFDNDLGYLNSLFSNTYLEFLDDGIGFIDFGFDKTEFYWNKNEEEIIINDSIIIKKIDNNLNIPLNKFSDYFKKDSIIISLKEGLTSNTLNVNRTQFINTQWYFTKLYDNDNGYYQNFFFNSYRERSNIDSISILFSENFSVFIIKRKENNNTHIFGNKDTLQNFWIENLNIISLIETTISKEYFFITPFYNNNELRIPMKDANKNIYYLIFEQINKL